MTSQQLSFAPTRAAGLQHLAAFVPRAGIADARRRNHDLPGHLHVSLLSPYIRHRMITEGEVIAAARQAHGAAAAKFVDEVLWRSYWKGYMELRTALWRDYRQSVVSGLDGLAAQSGQRTLWEAACNGTTGIEGFDDWAKELVATGYLHNHARMWFASIWIFTLGLPWALGADFFMRHLLDGDPASNMLSWRWVAGLHTPGKTYLATADAIAANTDGRFHTQGLARQAHRVEGLANPAPKQPPALGDWDATRPSAVLLHEEDLTPDWLLPATVQPTAAAFVLATAARSPLIVAERVQAFVKDAVDDAAQRLATRITTIPERLTADEVLKDWAVSTGASQIITPYAPLGPVSEMLDRLQTALEPTGISLIRLMRPWDAELWPYATQGFFRFRDAVQST